MEPEENGENVRRILVFDSGWGGELVADYLTRELGVVEIVRVIDWKHKFYADGTLDTDEAIGCLAPYVGTVDLVVLGGYVAGTLLSVLSEAYPEQLFVAPGVNYDKVLRARQYPEKIAVLMNSKMRESEIFRELRDKLPYSTIIIPECTNWEELIDKNLMTEEVVRTELAWDFETSSSGLNMNRGGTSKELSQVLKSSSTNSSKAVSVEKRALLQAIQNFDAAAKQASLKEKKAAIEARRVQNEALMNNTERVKLRPDLVLLLDTHFWEIKTEIEQSLGWRVRVLDFREKLLHDVCAALKLRGVDGRRPK